MKGAYFLTWLEPARMQQVEGHCKCAHMPQL